MHLNEEDDAMIGRRSDKAKRDVPTAPDDMPPKTFGGTRNPPRAPGHRAYEKLTDRDIDVRIEVATSQLRKLGAFQDTRSIPMNHLSDEQLDERIRQVEEELRRLERASDFDDEPRELTRAEKEAVVRQLEVLDYLIEHPHATIPPASSLDALDDEPRELTRAEKEAVVRQLEVLDYLIEHPHATIPPASSLDAHDDEPARWSAAFVAEDRDFRRGK
jgi:hypothetical protein